MQVIQAKTVNQEKYLKFFHNDKNTIDKLNTIDFITEDIFFCQCLKSKVWKQKNQKFFHYLRWMVDKNFTSKLQY